MNSEQAFSVQLGLIAHRNNMTCGGQNKFQKKFNSSAAVTNEIGKQDIN